MTKGKWIKSPWTISFGSAIFSLLLTMIYDYSKEKPILSTIWLILKWIINLIWSILNFDLKVWWIILAFAFIILLLYIIDKFKNDEKFKPDFYNYREDRFKRWRWSWEWEWSNSKKSWIISNLKAHCPNCNTPMIDHSGSYGILFVCPRCDFNASNEQCDEAHKIERIIIDNIERKRKKNENNP
ncbi:MAG: hypothetical protein AAGU19_07260 [Prolixibacteraceae bacterium]